MDRVKALGARWDAAQRQWYVPPGLDLAQFATWLPAKAGLTTAPTASQDLLAPAGSAVTAVNPTGVSLSQLLAGVERAVSKPMARVCGRASTW
nr:DUF5710 domain-containing protein [Alicycliphilus denitrificans]